MRFDHVHIDVETARRPFREEEVTYMPEVLQLTEVGETEKTGDEVNVLPLPGGGALRCHRRLRGG